MSNIGKQIALLLALAALVRPEAAQAATQILTVNASSVKPLQLTRLQDLDLGTITLKPGTWSGATVSISSAGTFSCTNSNTVCTGATQAASYNAQGTNKTVVQITAPNVTLVNQSSPAQTLTLVLDAPSTVTLTSSGVPGNNFAVGGSITVNSSAADGIYTGTLNVTVDF